MLYPGGNLSAFIKIRKGLAQIILLSVVYCCLISVVAAQNNSSKFKVVAFYTNRSDLAHISFVHEANKWFPAMAAKYHFTYDSTNNWNNLND
ncbi:MAG TPA: hypothetical protein VH396_06995, partial [Chitinophagaceae bacterium]